MSANPFDLYILSGGAHLETQSTNKFQEVISMMLKWDKDKKFNNQDQFIWD